MRALYKTIVFIISLLPVVWLSYGVLNNTLGANPVEVITRDTGEWALRFLLLTLAISPLRLLGWHEGIHIRRMLGLFSAFYALLHLLLYLGLDQGFVWEDILNDIIERPFIAVGFVSFLLLIPLVVTSNQHMITRLGSLKWKQLHRLIYLIAIGGVLHFFMLVKQDITEPVIYIAILAVLLGVRFFRYISHQNWPKFTRQAD